MSDELHRMVGELGGKMDSLTTLVRDYIEAHDARHRIIDEQVQQARDDINQAKGAKTALLALAGSVAGLVAILVAAAERMIKGG